MDRHSQVIRIRKLTAAPDSMVGNVHAITEDGTLVVAFATGRQLAPYTSTPGEGILVGSKKIMLVLKTAFRRIREYALP